MGFIFSYINNKCMRSSGLIYCLGSVQQAHGVATFFLPILDTKVMLCHTISLVLLQFLCLDLQP